MKPKLKKFAFRFTNSGLAELVCDFLKKEGYPVNGNHYDVKHTLSLGYDGGLYHNLLNIHETRRWGKLFDENSLTEFMTYIRTHAFEREIVLNNQYTAVVTKSGVKVGCQTFTHASILELAAAVEQAQDAAE